VQSGLHEFAHVSGRPTPHCFRQKCWVADQRRDLTVGWSGQRRVSLFSSTRPEGFAVQFASLIADVWSSGASNCASHCTKLTLEN
jgi:hypothetical protein